MGTSDSGTRGLHLLVLSWLVRVELGNALGLVGKWGNY